jgi:hypothetical protein
VLNFAVSLAVLTLLFKWLPDRQLAWREVWVGGFATALLFNIGKSAIAWYIGTQGFESTYGAVASNVALLIWVYIRRRSSWSRAHPGLCVARGPLSAPCMSRSRIGPRPCCNWHACAGWLLPRSSPARPDRCSLEC